MILRRPRTLTELVAKVGPFRILSLEHSLDAEGGLAARVYLAGSPFINLAVFESLP